MDDKQDATPAAPDAAPQKRKRGRPKGCKGDKTSPKFAVASAEADERAAHLAQQIYALAAEGMTLEQIAAFFNISVDTLKSWRDKNPRLERAWQQGTDDHTTGRLELSLKRRAEGYDWWEISRTYDGQGTLKERKKVKRHVPGDINALKLWVINRSSRWRHAIGDSQGVIVHKVEAVTKPRTAGMSDETKAKLEKPGKRQKKKVSLRIERSFTDKSKDKGREAA